MKHFIIKIFLFFFLVFLAGISGFLLPDDSYNQSIYKASVDKHKRLLQTQNSNGRIIILGGSGVSFGVYSPLIEEQTNKQVVNMGIHAGFGLKLMIDEVEPYINKGDQIIIIPEYNQFLGETYYGDFTLLAAVDANKNNLKYALNNWRQTKNIIENITLQSYHKYKILIKHLIKGESGFEFYKRESFNQQGDATEHWSVNQSLVNIKPKELTMPYSAYSTKRIQEFHDFIKSKEAELFLSYPCLNQSEFVLNKGTIKKIQEKIEAMGIPILGTPESFSFPDSCYLDTSYHLLKDAQIERTKRLIHYYNQKKQ